METVRRREDRRAAGVFRNFLRGMETRKPIRCPPLRTHFRNFLRGMETCVVDALDDGARFLPKLP